MTSTESNPLPRTVERLEDSSVLRKDRLFSWVVTIAVTLFAFAIRIINLSRPTGLMFDETYYAKDAWSLLHFGYERSWPKDANAQILEGNTDVWLDSASFIVHPQLGKWLIAAGEYAFGMNSFGWRISACVFGTLLVFITTRLARRLSRSTLVGGIAGFLLAIDGLAFTMSRIALLDIFQAFFTVAAVAAVVADRDWFRLKLAQHLRETGQPNLAGQFGPLLTWRPWRLVAGVLFGLAIGVKWNSLYVLAAMGLASVLMDYRSRRTAGADRKSWYSFLVEGPVAFCYLVVTAAIVYVSTWASWLYTTGGWKRDWGWNNPDDPLVRLIGAPLASLWQYHKEIFRFHTGDYMASVTHTYEAHPAGWLVIGRSIGMYAENGIQPGVDGCAAVDSTCLRVVSGMGTPLLWWFAVIAILAALVWWLGGRDWRFAIPLLAAGAVWIGWFPNADRPLFFFYAIMLIPFTVTILAMALGKILGPADSDQRAMRAAFVGGVVLLVLLNFVFIYPVLTGELLTREAWSLRMWFRSWI